MEFSMKTLVTIGLTALALSAGVLAASAQTPPPYFQPTVPYMMFEGRSVGRTPYPHYPFMYRDRSGTAGRLDFGADPHYPEGPGNPSGDL
jgi:hypothetical protein